MPHAIIASATVAPWHHVAPGVNLGKLAPGNYELKCVIAPLAFKQFERNGRPVDEQRRDNWPQDEQPTDSKPVELPLTFTIVSQ